VAEKCPLRCGWCVNTGVHFDKKPNEKLHETQSVSKAPASCREQGLTLIELLVVLVVLVALAGIIVPQLPNMITKAHTATCSTNIGETSKIVQTFENLYFKDPNNLDNLTDGATNLIDYLPGATPGTPGTSAAGGDIGVTTLTQDQVTALKGAGITTVSPLIGTQAAVLSAGQTPTAYPYVTGSGGTITPTTLASTVSVATLSTAAVQRTLKPTVGAADVYVAFGIGQNSEMTGNVLSQAPTHFDDDPSNQSADRYARFLAVYQVTATAADGVTAISPANGKAQFIGTVAAHSGQVVNASNEVNDYMNTNKLN